MTRRKSLRAFTVGDRSRAFTKTAYSVKEMQKLMEIAKNDGKQLGYSKGWDDGYDYANKFVKEALRDAVERLHDEMRAIPRGKLNRIYIRCLRGET